MNIKLLTLTLQNRKSREVLNLESQITCFHGQISAGKSSIMRLIDYCFGGDLERTPAISQEAVSVELTAKIENFQVLFEREAKRSNQIQVTWKDDDGRVGSVLAPIDASAQPIWEDKVFNLSDLIFYLAGYTPIKVRKSKHDERTKLVRLSFRDMMWYCYLEQDHLDSSFYRLDDPFRKLKSRDAMRFVIGFYTERMNDLEIELDETRNSRLTKKEAAIQIRTFLEDFGYGVESEIFEEIRKVEVELYEAENEQKIIRNEFKEDTHFVDEIRSQLRTLSNEISNQKGIVVDLEERISEQEALKSELLSTKFKLAKAKTASNILSGVNFEYCPLCGCDLDNESTSDAEHCKLCKSKVNENSEDTVDQAKVIQNDLTSRVEDLSESLERHNNSISKQTDLLRQLEQEKSELDKRLMEELSNYDSAYLARYREVERRIATFSERKKNLEKTAKMLESIAKLEEEANRLKDKEEEIKNDIEIEKKKLSDAEKHLREIEEAYLECLLVVGVPGVSKNDKIKINRTTWIPWIIPAKGDSYTFYNAGSGGKKTLLNACYALAVHKVASDNNLPLPKFLMIDTPMKNIGEDVNENIFKAFYKYLYELALGALSTTQFIIIDKEYFKPDADMELDINDRYMSPDNPLISYYRGP